MKNLYNTKSLLFTDHNNMFKGLGGYNEQFSSMVYEKWLYEWTAEKHGEIIKTLNKFVGSKIFVGDVIIIGKQSVA